MIAGFARSGGVVARAGHSGATYSGYRGTMLTKPVMEAKLEDSCSSKKPEELMSGLGRPHGKNLLAHGVGALFGIDTETAGIYGTPWVSARMGDSGEAFTAMRARKTDDDSEYVFPEGSEMVMH